MFKPKILSQVNVKPFFFKEGCTIRELSNSDADPNVSIAEATVGRAVTTRWHSLSGIWERYVVLQGHGRVELEDTICADITVGDTVVIPPDIPQRISNIGDQDLKFLAICSPRFCEQAYVDLESD